METNWLRLWRDLVSANPHIPTNEAIKRYKTHALRKRHRPDPLLDFVVQSIDSSTTVLDIGAGSGRWTIALAATAKSVTAVEPSSEMLEVLRNNMKNASGNIQTVQSSWEAADVAIHDVAVCAHAMYSSPDLAYFVQKMERHARKTCYLAVRLLPVDGVISELHKAIYSSPHDSANAVIAFNALYYMGIYANVMIENDIYRWVNTNLDEAFLRAKRHLRLESNNDYDKLIQDTLNKRLTLSEKGYVWPDGMRSALLYWNPRPPKQAN